MATGSLPSFPYITSWIRAQAKTPVIGVVEYQTVVEFEVETPYSLRSAGEPLKVDLMKHNVEVSYHYYAVPKLDRDAFLVAQITEWEQYNLLEGEANLYFEDAYVGRTVITPGVTDTLEISLGRDKNIQIDRVKNTQHKRVRFIGSNTVDQRVFDITVRNRKSQDIHLTLIDQIPVSVVSNISVSLVSLSGGTLDDASGLVKWTFSIGAQQQKALQLHYEVKYPRNESVLLE